MSRNMWILAALFAVLGISMIYQSEFGGGIDRPWAECKENLVTQMLTGDCTPRTGVFTSPTRAGGTDGGDPDAPATGNDLDSSPLVEQR